jgi:phosphoglycolate phosphatase
LELVNQFDLHYYIKGIVSLERGTPFGKEELSIEEKYGPGAVMVSCRKACLHSGKENDLYTVGCSWGASPGEKLEEADAIIHTFSELERMLTKKEIYQ